MNGWIIRVGGRYLNKHDRPQSTSPLGARVNTRRRTLELLRQLEVRPDVDTTNVSLVRAKWVGGAVETVEYHNGPVDLEKDEAVNAFPIPPFILGGNDE